MRKEVFYSGLKTALLDEKPVEFTHRLDEKNGWVDSEFDADEFDSVLYLGRCRQDGDMFAATDDGNEPIMIFKGHLNSGKY